MTATNKFGFAPLADTSPAPRRARGPGPMGAAVRETAADLEASTEAMVEQRRRNAGDARAWREAESAGLVLRPIPLAAIATDALPRDRLDLDAVAASDEMEELKASIRARGQREPIEVWADGEDRYQLKTGWRRLAALRQLHHETRDDRFATVVARVGRAGESRMDRYVDMVEENVVREDLTFAEMAQVAIEAAADPAVDDDRPEALVARLYGALHKVKRSYVKAFVALLVALGPDLRWPKAVPRDLGVAAARAIVEPGALAGLRARLRDCADAEAQNAALASFVGGVEARGRGPARAAPRAASPTRLAFRVGGTRVEARDGEVRIASGTDFSKVSRERLERATRAFEAEIAGRQSIRSL